VSLATTTNADAAAANVLHAEDDWIWIRDDSRTRPGLRSPESRINIMNWRRLLTTVSFPRIHPLGHMTEEYLYRHRVDRHRVDRHRVDRDWHHATTR
jgi:hypothetical protein